MNKGLAACGIVIMFVICIALVIFAPKKHVFHDIESHYPGLLTHFQDAQLELIHQEVDLSDWVDANDQLHNEKSSYKLIKIYDDRMYLVDIKKYPQTVSIISQIPKLIGAYLARLGPKSILKVQKNDERFMRISIPLERGFDTADHCGVWVKQETRCLHRKIMYDTSNIFSMYNKTGAPIKFLILEMEWPETLVAPKTPHAKTDLL